MAVYSRKRCVTKAFPIDQCRKQIPFIPRRITGVQQPIQIMPQLLCEHRDYPILTRRSQPIPIQINRACANRIGPCSTWHGTGWHQHHRRKISEIAFAPFLYKLTQLLRFPLQLQCGLSGPRESAVRCPQDQKLSPILQVRLEKIEV